MQSLVPPQGIGLSVVVFGKFTLFLMIPRSRKSRSSFTAITAQLSSASGVEAPKCGRQITLSQAISSSAAKSVTMHEIFPALIAARTSSLFTSPPRAMFMSFTPFFMFLIVFALTKPFVSGVSGTWKVR